MQFVKLVALYHFDPAVSEGLSDAGEVAFTRSIGYAGAAETSGFIPTGQMPSLVRKYTPAKAKKVAAELLAAGLWIEVKGGWQLRTWQKHQDELERLLARRKADVDRQRRHRRKPGRGPEPEPDPHEHDEPSHQPSRDNGSHVSRDKERDQSREPLRNSLSRVRGPEELEIEEEEKNQTPPTTSSSSPPRSTTGTRLPDDFPVTDEMKRWAAEHAPLAAARDHEKFLDHWRSTPGAKGRKLDWQATWRNWMRRENDQRAEPRASTTDARMRAAQSLRERAAQLDEADPQLALDEGGPRFAIGATA